MSIKKGDKFNFLTAIKFVEMKKNSQQYWLFKCECGNEKVISISRVKSGNTKSCGCLYRNSGRKTKHGMINTRTYKSWEAMRTRCLNKNYLRYKEWGGRGIKVCKRWIKFENFYKDMGERPTNTSLDRIDNNGNYKLNNCRWATPKEQVGNRRVN